MILPPGEEAEICFFNMPETCQPKHTANDVSNNQIFLFALTVLCYMEHFTAYAKMKNSPVFCYPKYIVHNIDTKATGKEKNGLIYKAESQFLNLLGFIQLQARAKKKGGQSTATNSFIYNII